MRQHTCSNHHLKVSIILLQIIEIKHSYLQVTNSKSQQFKLSQPIIQLNCQNPILIPSTNPRKHSQSQTKSIRATQLFFSFLRNSNSIAKTELKKNQHILQIRTDPALKPCGNASCPYKHAKFKLGLRMNITYNFNFLFLFPDILRSQLIG